MSDNYDVAVAYRIYPKVSKVPPVFAEDKYRLSELCLGSFRKSLGSLRVKMFVILDNCPPEYEELFRRHFEERDLEFIRLNGAGNYRTFELQIEILLQQKCSENVYFAEDDYYYLPGQFPAMVDYINSGPDIDFVTPFDHIHYYTLDLHRHSNEIRVHGSKHWRTANSTCLTFLTTKRTLASTKRVFRTYRHKNNDSSIWLSLTKYRVFNPILPIKYFFGRQWFLLEIISFAWLFCWSQILFGRQRKLWASIPSIATHMNSKLMAPVVDWTRHFTAVQQ